MYILKQLFFSISVSISVFGLRNIYLAASQLGKLHSYYSPQFKLCNFKLHNVVKMGFTRRRFPRVFRE